MSKQLPPFRGIGASARPWNVKGRAIRRLDVPESDAAGTERTLDGRIAAHACRPPLASSAKAKLTDARPRHFCRCEFAECISNSHLQIRFIRNGRSPVSWFQDLSIRADVQSKFQLKRSHLQKMHPGRRTRPRNPSRRTDRGVEGNHNRPLGKR